MSQDKNHYSGMMCILKDEIFLGKQEISEFVYKLIAQWK